MEPLTKKTFKNLTKTEQVVMVLKSGKELLTRQDEKYFVKLFSLTNLLVEIWYELNQITILKVSTPSNDKIMQNYNIDKASIKQLTE